MEYYIDMDALNSKEVIIVNKGAWTAEEDRRLAEVVAVHGPRRWKIVAAKAGLNRCGKSCRLRWMNYLRPNIKRGDISDQEEDLILRLHKLLGNRWSLIAGRLPGRTDNEIKNYWNSHLSKKVSMEVQQKTDYDDGDNQRYHKDLLGQKLSRSGFKRRRVSEDEYNMQKKQHKAEEEEEEEEEEEQQQEEDNNNNNNNNNNNTYINAATIYDMSSMAKNGHDIIGEESGSCSFNVDDDFFDFSSEDPLNLDWITRFLNPASISS